MPRFFYVEFDEQWTGISSIDNLSFINGSFTTLNNINQNTFSYIGSLNSDAQTQINNVSILVFNHGGMGRTHDQKVYNCLVRIETSGS